MQKVVSVTVAYKPNPDLLIRQLLALSSQVDVMIVVDNGGENSSDWHGRAAMEAGAHIISLSTNAGIAAAQNAGIRFGLDVGATHVLLMDHDSVPSPGMVKALLAAELKFQAAGIDVAVIGPVSVDRRTGTLSVFNRLQGLRVVRLQCLAATDDPIEADFLIASGSLIPAAAFKVVGLMNEGFFIDHVDTEWCLRARSKGLRIFGICGARLEHHLGDSVVRVWLGRWREVSVHSPQRNYYLFRNTILMLRFTPMPWIWRMSHACRLLQYVVFSALALQPRWKRIGLMSKGAWHGLIGRTGPAP